jgi:hypothetical protein
VSVRFGAEHGRGMGGNDEGHQWLLTERKREMGRVLAQAAPHGGRRRGGALARSRHMEEDGVGGLAVGKAHGRWRWWPVWRLPREQGSGVKHVGRLGNEGAGPSPIEQC